MCSNRCAKPGAVARLDAKADVVVDAHADGRRGVVRRQHHPQSVRQLVILHRHLEFRSAGRTRPCRQGDRQQSCRYHREHSCRPLHRQKHFSSAHFTQTYSEHNSWQAPRTALDRLEFRRTLHLKVSWVWPGRGRQYTARRCSIPLLASTKRGSAAPSPNSAAATYSPSAGPCLNPCPDPPPANHTLSICGWRSIRKSPLEVFSYWHTRVSTIGASRSAGKRFATYFASLLGRFRRDRSRLRVRINPDSVMIQCHLEAARFQVRHPVHFVSLDQPGRHGRCGKLVHPRWHAEKENFLTTR